MPYDRELAERVRGALGAAGVSADEKAMFGGLAFLVRGNMTVCAASGGQLMVRCEPDDLDAHAAEPGVEPMVMRGRPMAGWLLVSPDALGSEAELAAWVGVGVARSASLPPK